MTKNEILEVLNEIYSNNPDFENITRYITKVELIPEEELNNRTAELDKKNLEQFIENEIEKEKQSTIYNKNVTLNDYFEYGIDEDTIHIHLPKDLHEEFRNLGTKKALAQIGVYLIDAVNKINNERNSDNEDLKRCRQIYMISPIFYSRKFYPQNLRKIGDNISIESPVLILLKKLGINTRTITAQQIQDRNNLEADSEIQLAYKHFGDERDIGVASLDFEKLNTKKWKKILKQSDIILRKYIGVKEIEL